LYDAPANRYVADFVGESNFFSGQVTHSSPRAATIRTDSGIMLSAPLSPAGGQIEEHSRAVIAVRPEFVRLWRQEPPADAAALACAVKGRINNRIYLGDQTEFSIQTAELGDILVRASKETGAMSNDYAPGNEVTLGWHETRALALADS
ncbi:MAG: TOBE domain-containing protein, partial [Dongiaceae bacterium]